MLFNFSIFRVLATRAYRNIGHSCFSLDEVLEVFNCYFSNYERYKRKAHPNIRAEQIQRLIEIMPFLVDENRNTLELSADVYEDITRQHFQTKYRNCDYNINHFFSGQIRLMRFYEAAY
jgi:hypothetical protein